MRRFLTEAGVDHDADKGFLARIEFDEEARIFHGEVVTIRDAIIFQGKT
ncbi:hypothetical protein GWN75_30145 [candidate division KSB1 bacterium]|nr:hypothetical protein [candidate division KSB1 bacterium]NIV71638.1 hypothetical protein [Calditrichia bacterium]NIS28027.1 hypothetical protein [candidate division KSB1 bacterium]NIU28682.1 hypothetical protein [candidate division KSB1 bacterium]NIW22585.1 hypothetical protein [candidate division KSB1 bacterium]